MKDYINTDHPEPITLGKVIVSLMCIGVTFSFFTFAPQSFPAHQSIKGILAFMSLISILYLGFAAVLTSILQILKIIRYCNQLAGDSYLKRKERRKSRLISRLESKLRKGYRVQCAESGADKYVRLLDAGALPQEAEDDVRELEKLEKSG